MNVLIVDDDRFVVSALEKQIDWATLGIDAVYCAYNIRQAQKILENQSVQIMVSDIEMPQGSGLDLLQWIRQSNRKLQVIFLTSYSDFHYAQQALELQSLNYLLKPIEFEKLTEIIHQAALRIQAEERDEEDRENSRFWKVNRKNLITHFWHNLLSGKIISSKDGISGVLAEEKLNYTLSDAFLPLLIQVYPDTPEIQGWEKTSFDYGLKI